MWYYPPCFNDILITIVFDDNPLNVDTTELFMDFVHFKMYWNGVVSVMEMQ